MVAACLPVLLLGPGYAVLTARGVPAADAVVFGPAVTIAIVATAVLAAVIAGVPAAVASWVIVLGLIALAAALVARKAVPRPDASARRPVLLMLIAFALLGGVRPRPVQPAIRHDDLRSADEADRLRRAHREPAPPAPAGATTSSSSVPSRSSGTASCPARDSSTRTGASPTSASARPPRATAISTFPRCSPPARSPAPTPCIRATAFCRRTRALPKSWRSTTSISSVPSPSISA